MTVKIFALGDSITYGFPYGPHQSWVRLVSQWTSLDIVNGGINGDTTTFMLHRLSAALEENPTHLIFLGGTNDAYWGQALRVVAENVLEVHRRCQERGVQLIMGLPIPVDEPQVDALLSEYRAFYQDLADREGLPVIPFHKAFYDAAGRFKTQLTTDGCHPNIDGYEAMAEVAEKAVKNLWHNRG
ncbi:GDSL-type esterase/lipase family protein [Dethiobacter alkaliphilus]|uniref:GDSL-type esterase/lipase family protein n=1 Tax=Dethiobacter alkaliphilus TaxID=427926 RepID=UPI0022262BCF|nr:GDSL-type esterase/lipase family protein [Dethiobacter alkaliphilus]MCW3490737.1 GDSL-type esterase/lipase family protein [Dethiobacter alkaliphilus]